MFSVHETSGANYCKYLAKLNLEAADAADKSVGLALGCCAASDVSHEPMLHTARMSALMPAAVT